MISINALILIPKIMRFIWRNDKLKNYWTVSMLGVAKSLTLKAPIMTAADDIH